MSALAQERDAATLRASELDYELPEELIAQAPLPERDAARLLCLPRPGAELEHRHVRELPELIEPTLIVLNDTRVVPARLLGHKPSGGRVELLLLERAGERGPSERWNVLAKGLRPGERAQLADGQLQVRLIERTPTGALAELASAGDDVSASVARLGRTPLPPYIRRAPDAHDAERYQTVYAAHDGAVAAPTAGLHLTRALLERLRAAGHQLAYVTLHVGPGTFAPLRSERLDEHVMHAERYQVPDETAALHARARREGRPVLAIGTTVVRALESAADAHGSVRAGAGRTALFIRPPYRAKTIDALLTNFHLPRSTLLALVMALGGVANVRRAYADAVARRYRFFSYGDAMLVLPGAMGA